MKAHSMSGSASRRRLQWCKLLAGAGGAVLVAFWIATLANVPGSVLELPFAAVIIAVLPVAWWAAFSAPPELRRFLGTAVAALSLQVIGTGLWYAAYLQHGSVRLPALGYWSPPLYLELLLASAAVWSVVRGMVRPRDALLDYSIVVAAAASVAFAVIEPHLHTAGWSAQTIAPVVRPLLSLLIVVLIASVMLGAWQALPLSVGLVGLCLLLDVIGLFLAGYFESRGVYTDDRWPDLLWCTAAVIAFFAALTIIAGKDRAIRVARQGVPGAGPLALAITIMSCWVIAGAVVLYGALSHHRPALIGGAVAVAWIGVAAVLRTTAALAETRSAYRELDEAHFSLEQTREQRDAVITQLERRNVELTAIQTMYGPMLDMANERTNGQLRSNLEDAGDDLAEWLLDHRSEASSADS